MKRHVWNGQRPIPCSMKDCDAIIYIGDVCYQIISGAKPRYVCEKCGEMMLYD